MAQGKVNFANATATSPLLINNGTIAMTGANSAIVTPGAITARLGTASTAQFGIGPASVRVELLAGLTSTSLSAVLVGSSSSWAYATNTASTLGAAQGTFPGGTGVILPAPYDGSGPVFFQARAWSIGADNVTSWEGRFATGAGFAGITGIISASPATGVAIPPQLFTQFGALTLYSIPEPSTFALAGLGAAAMLIFRRRK